MTSRVNPSRINGLILAGLAAITLALYWPVVRHEFIEYDDQQYVTENARVQAGLTWKGFVWAFGFHANNWHPLAWLSHMLDCQLYGLNPAGHHLTSILLHVGGALLLFLALERMTGARWRSAAVAALFAWHPLHVESVAWLAERKDVLCAFFWMLTLLLYAHYVEQSKIKNQKSKIFYWLTLISFALCLMAKPMGITLPCVMLLLDYWRIADCGLRIADLEKGKLTRLFTEKIPFFVLIAGSAVLTLKAQADAMITIKGLSPGQRVLHTFVAYAHYLSVTFLPRNMAVYYPYKIATPIVEIVSAIAVIGGITALAVKWARSRPYFIVGWLWLLGTLVPVIGLVQVGDQAWADRYTYLPLVGVFITVVWGAAEVIKQTAVLKIVAVGTAVVMIFLTSAQLRYWQDTRTLFQHAYDVTHENFLAITVLGSVLAKEGKLDEAIEKFQLALKYKPGLPEAYFYLGNAFEQQGKLDEAVAAYEKALWFKPIQEQTHIFIGIILGKQLKYEEAIQHYVAALKINPDSPVAHNNLARIYHTQGRLDEAVNEYRAALALDPKLALAHNNLGVLMLQKENVAEGVSHLREAVRLKPGNTESEYNLALALNQQQQWAEAAGLFKNTVMATSTDPKAHYEFGCALAHLQKTREAMGQYAAALLSQPDFPEALDGLSWILATSTNADFRNGAEAVRMAGRACELTGRKNPAMLKTLAAAYAEAGNFQEAITTVQAAREMAVSEKRDELARECERMIGSFEKAKPWRDSP